MLCEIVHYEYNLLNRTINFYIYAIISSFLYLWLFIQLHHFVRESSITEWRIP